MGEKFVSLSFGTISGSGPNGSVIHYHPEGNVPIDPNTLYLVDSGAQYLDGTTDVTRTLYLGDLSYETRTSELMLKQKEQQLSEFRKRFTLVLKSHIALARARFPIHTP